jgi:hypothetical protein
MGGLVGMPSAGDYELSRSESKTNGNRSTQWEPVDKTARSLGVRGVGSSNLPVPTIEYPAKTFSKSQVVDERLVVAGVRLRSMTATVSWRKRPPLEGLVGKGGPDQ